jgi:hypothetical protein
MLEPFVALSFASGHCSGGKTAATRVSATSWVTPYRANTRLTALSAFRSVESRGTSYRT